MGVVLLIVNVGVILIVDVVYVLILIAVYIFVFGIEVELVKVEDGKGMGIWVYCFGKDVIEGVIVVKLNVLGKVIKLVKEYCMILIWILKFVLMNVGG